MRRCPHHCTHAAPQVFKCPNHCHWRPPGIAPIHGENAECLRALGDHRGGRSRRSDLAAGRYRSDCSGCQCVRRRRAGAMSSAPRALRIRTADTQLGPGRFARGVGRGCRRLSCAAGGARRADCRHQHAAARACRGNGLEAFERIYASAPTARRSHPRRCREWTEGRHAVGAVTRVAQPAECDFGLGAGPWSGSFARDAARRDCRDWTQYPDPD